MTKNGIIQAMMHGNSGRTGTKSLLSMGNSPYGLQPKQGCPKAIRTSAILPLNEKPLDNILPTAELLADKTLFQLFGFQITHQNN